MATNRLEKERDFMIEAMLPDVAFDGWNTDLLTQTHRESGIKTPLSKLFPKNIQSVLDHFADKADRAMLAELDRLDLDVLRIRDRIGAGVMARLNALDSHKPAVSAALGWYALPPRSFLLPKIVWRTADRLWWAAGDTATDYNHYTKRGLLSGVLSATTLYWLNDSSDDHGDTQAFLDRRIDNVMTIGKTIGKATGKFRKTA